MYVYFEGLAFKGLRATSYLHCSFLIYVFCKDLILVKVRLWSDLCFFRLSAYQREELILSVERCGAHQSDALIWVPVRAGGNTLIISHTPYHYMKIEKTWVNFIIRKYFWYKMNVRYPIGGFYLFSIKYIIYDKMDLKLFYLWYVTMFRHLSENCQSKIVMRPPTWKKQKI